MSLSIIYKNEYGTVVMVGGGSSATIRITEVEGLGLVSREYVVATYTGYDGQETISSRAISRAITLAIEICSRDAPQIMRDALMIFGKEGYLYIHDDTINRRIKCNQVQCPDVTRVLKGQIATFVVQFVCDNPYFEDAEDTVVPLYQRVKLLSSPFSLPTAFVDIVHGATVKNIGVLPVEPIITLYYPSALENVERILLRNETSGTTVCLDYAPSEAEIVTIDIKNRRIIGSVGGNLIGFLSEDTFLGDFVLERGVNVLTVDIGDVAAGFTLECRYNNLYSEAVIV